MRLRGGLMSERFGLQAVCSIRGRIRCELQIDRRPQILLSGALGPFRAHSCRARHQFSLRLPRVTQREQRPDPGRAFLQLAESTLESEAVEVARVAAEKWLPLVRMDQRF